MKNPLVRLAIFLFPLLASAQAPSTSPGPAPAPDLAVNPAAAATPLDPALPTLFIAGDSTAAKNRGDPIQGWGVPFAGYFDPARLNVVNRARGGRSSRTFITEGLWDQLLADVKAGDTVLIQFGHNDASPVNEEASVPPERRRARGTIKGIGEETEEVDNIITGEHEFVHSYGWYVRKYIREARAAGATPIVCSLTPRKSWKEGKIVRSGPDGYGGWARQVAEQEGAAFIDVNDLVASRYEALGPEKVDPLFGDANLHTSKAGADLNAEIVAAALRALPGDPLGGFAR